jgi:4-amino-4-deoxy-L-arabinose transferase-like glycosyltransferase
MQSSYKAQALLALIIATALAPFVNKAFYVDDPLFIWMAQQIVRHPFDPYGFDLNWSSFTQPMSAVMQNPPLCSYYIATIGSIFGWSEISLHVAFLFWATMSILGTFALAQRFCGLEGRARSSPSSQGPRPPDKRANAAPFQAALLTLFTPIFLVSATTVMCDVMMLALWIWALEFWLAGLERKRWSRFLISVALISAAVLTKYFGIVLVPLLAAYTLLRDRRLVIYLPFLLIPFAVVSNYEWITEERYGQGLFSAAMTVSSTISSATRPSHVVQLLIGLAFAGGCLLTATFFTPPRRRRILLTSLVIFGVFVVAFKYLIVSWVYLEGSEGVVCLEGAVFATVGVGILALASANSVARRNADALFLLLWVFGTMAFAVWLNAGRSTARTFLPMTPAVTILTIARFEQCQMRSQLKYFFFIAAAALSLSIAAADYCQAQSARAAARLCQQRYGAERNRVRFLGHGGFQYYMEQWGATPFDRKNPELLPGDILISSLSDLDLAQVLGHKPVTIDEMTFSAFPFIATSRIGTGASFYSSFGGPLPWVINKVPPERYLAARIR